jgi:putative Mg2+ transporter-C (MgtC) family protein
MDFDWQLSVRILVAAVLGALVWLEREWRDKPAGVRTYALVALGAAVFTVAAVRYSLDQTKGQFEFDPTRVIQGIVGGIGFLGAGAILHSHGSVEGLTTAAGVWVMGAVGVACGLGYYDLATSVLTLFATGLLGYVFHHKESSREDP